MCLETFIVLEWLSDFPFSVALNHIDLCCGTAGARVRTAMSRLRIVKCFFFFFYSTEAEFFEISERNAIDLQKNSLTL